MCNHRNPRHRGEGWVIKQQGARGEGGTGGGGGGETMLAREGGCNVSPLRHQDKKCACVRACVRACVHVCVCVCVCVCVLLACEPACDRACVCVCGCVGVCAGVWVGVGGGGSVSSLVLLFLLTIFKSPLGLLHSGK